MSLSAKLDQVHELAQPLAESMGFEILLIEDVMDQGRQILRIFLDRVSADQSVSLEDCEAFSRALDPILEVEGELPGRYHLEVSSPGVNRPLVKKNHFEQQVGQVIEVTTNEKIEGRGRFKGLLKKVAQQESGFELGLEIDSKDYYIPNRSIKKAHLDYFASEGMKKKKK